MVKSVQRLYDNTPDVTPYQTSIDPVTHGSGASNVLSFSSSTSSSNVVKPESSSQSEGNLLLVITVVAVVIGFVLGIMGRMLSPSDDIITLVSFPGEMFMGMLKMLILPLVVSSVVAGLAQMDPKSSGKIGMRALTYYFATTIIASILGIIMATVINPGDPSLKTRTAPRSEEVRQKLSTMDAFLDLIRNMFPENLVQACIQRAETQYENVTSIEVNTGEKSYRTQRKMVYKDGTNILGILVFFVVFGIVTGQMENRADIVVRFFVQLNDVTMRMVFLVIWFSPLGIMSLIIGRLLSLENIDIIASQLGLYMLTTFLALLVHALIMLPLIYFLITRQNPCAFLKGMMQAIATALATSSSSATLPVTFRCLEENLNIDKRVTRFILPIGATVNMDGVAMHEPIIALFIAQINNISLGFGDLTILTIMSIASSIGAAAIPSAGIVTTLLVLTSAGLPTDDVSFVIAVDWIIDRGRTAVNVLGDAFGAGIVDYMIRKEPEKKVEKVVPQVAPKTIPVVQTVDNSGSESTISEYDEVRHAV